MSDPAVNLMLACGLALAGAALFWPGWGAAARVRRAWRTSERVRVEDMLKQMYKLRRERRTATAVNIADGTGMGRQASARLLRLLEERGFVETRGPQFLLTEAGRTYALRVVRAHRLWERFLADRTGVGPEDWHEEAEAQEHALTASAADDLAAALGNPAYDPHGDPIPSAEVDVPERAGVPLTCLEAGLHAVVVHVEDEPRDAYQQLVALGLGPEIGVQRLDGSADPVRVRVDGVERELAAALAANVAVTPDVRRPGPSRPATLAQLELGREAVVAGLSPLCRGPARRRLLDLGLVPGTAVAARLQAPGAGPVAYEVRGAMIALRREQAARVHLEAAGGGRA